MSAAPRRVVVVGGGVAAHVLVTTLRSAGFDGDVTVLTREAEGPYDRPPLSKALLTDGNVGEAGSDPASFGVDYESIGVAVCTDTVVTGLTRSAVRTASGEHRYDVVVLASGSEPIELPGQRDCPTAISLRTRRDAVRLRSWLEPSARVVIVGSGWIGAEVATAAVDRGCRVTVVDAADYPLATALPENVGSRTASWYKRAGVELRLGSPVERVLPDGVLLADGRVVAADVVITGVGAKPATSYLQEVDLGLTLAPDGSVLTDERLAAIPGRVYAVGDVARWRSSRFGTIRTEHWDHAVASATHVARGVLGAADRYDPVPYIWSDQFGRRLQYVGHHHSPSAPHIHRADDHDWSAWWMTEDRLTAVLAVDQPRLVRAARRAIADGLRLPLDTGARARAVADLAKDVS